LSTPTDTDRHDLVTLAKRWTPRGMVREESGRRLMAAIAEQLGDLLNPLIDFERYAPILLNPHRCADDDIERILALQGIDARRGSLSYEKLRRLAILGADLRAWRGAFRSHRTVATALTSGPVIIRTWILQRAILDESSIDLVLLDDDDKDETQLFVIGQGEGADEYNESELSDRLDELAKPVLDTIDIIPCFAVTAWRNGINGWTYPSVASRLSLVQSAVEGEYAGLDIGPAITAPPTTPFVRSVWQMDAAAGEDHAVWATIWFQTDGATDDTFWEAWVFGGTLGPYGTAVAGCDGYVARVHVGNHEVELYRRTIAGVYTLFGTHPFNISDGLTGGSHRLDIVCRRTSAIAARMRVYVDHDPSPWFDDPDPVISRPDGRHVWAGCKTGDFTSGTLRIIAVTAQKR
jgi:hypothetical protein